MQTGEWTTRGWPGWKDIGRLVEIQVSGGSTIRGRVIVEDVFTDDEGDEVPMFGLCDSDGNEHSFALHERWRFVDDGCETTTPDSVK